MNKDKRVYELNKDLSILYPKNLFIPQLLKLLWENPEIVADMLMDSSPSNIKETLIPLIATNFYENILSSKFIQSNLIYIIGLLLKNEIEKLSEPNPEKFLDRSSISGCLIYEMRYKNDSQFFIKKIIEDAVGKIDEYHNILCFDIKEINKYLTNKIQDIKHEKIVKDMNFEISEKEILNDLVIKKLRKKINKQKLDEFINTYMKDIELEKDFNNKSNINKDIKDYFNDSIIKRKDSFLTHINNYLKETLDKYEYKNEILLFYLNDFNIVTDFINDFLKNLLDNISIIPYSIKIICKFISILIKKKFPDSSKIEHNAFIARFFFCTLFWPLLKDSSFGALIDNYIIPINTMNNLDTIIDIFLQFIMGKLFDKREKSFLCPINKFFIEKMPDLIEFIDNLINENLPQYLQNIIDDKKDYKFDFYTENKNDGFFEQSILFTIHDIQDIIIHVKKNEKKIKEEKNKKFEGCFEKLMDSETANIIFNIKEKEEKNNKLYFFLISEHLYLNNKIKKLFKMEQFSKFFQIKEIKNPKSEEEKKQNLIIKVKNFIIAVLYKFIILTKEHFPKNSLNNINDIFKELLSKSTIPNYIMDDEIPTQWYVKSILDNLSKLPKDLTDNNCQKLIEGIINEVNLSIKEIDLITLTSIKSKLTKSSYKNPINILKNFYLNRKVESIIKSEIIKVGLYFHYDKNNSIFNIVKDNSILDFSIIEDENSFIDVNKNISNHIVEFINNFPDFTLYERFQDVDILKLEENLNVPTQIFNYLKIINNHLKKIYKFQKEELSEIIDRIYDYIMMKLYDKLYPQEQNSIDKKNYQNTIIYAWTEPQHFIKGKSDSTYDSFLPDIIKYLKSFINEKSPAKKIKFVSKALKSIENVIQFNGISGLLGVDDFISILSYSIIKGQLYRLPSNINYTLLYDPKNIKGSENMLNQLLLACNYITNLSYSSLYNISKEEFDEKMKRK